MGIDNINMKSFIADSIIELMEHEVTILLRSEDHVRLYDDMDVNGYFVLCEKKQYNARQYPEREFAVATGMPLENWLPVFVHEFNHFRQWKEQDPTYLKAFDGNPDEGALEAIEYVNEWVEHESQLSDTEIQVWVERAREMEADCERRTYHMIEERNLPIDLVSYARMANAYIHFYNFVGKNREWYAIGKEPYRVPEVVHRAGIEPTF